MGERAKVFITSSFNTSVINEFSIVGLEVLLLDLHLNLAHYNPIALLLIVKYALPVSKILR